MPTFIQKEKSEVCCARVFSLGMGLLLTIAGFRAICAETRTETGFESECRRGDPAIFSLASAKRPGSGSTPGLSGISESGSKNRVPSFHDVGARKLEAPCRIVNPRLGLLYRDPEIQKTHLALNSCTSPGPGSALLIDYRTGRSRVLPFPLGGGGWDVIQVAPDRLLFESLGPLHLIPVDLNACSLVKEDIVPVQGSAYAWRFAMGPGGWVYMGSYPSCHLYRYHPIALQVEDLGMIGPEGNLYVRFLGVTRDEWVLCSVMMEKSGVIAYHIPSRKQHWVEGAVDAAGKGVAPDLAGVDGVVYANHLKGELQQFDTAALQFKAADLPAPPKGLKWVSILLTSTREKKVVCASNGTYYLIQQGKAPQAIWNLNLRGGSIVAVDEENRVIGFRGQDYFAAKPMASTLDLQPLAKDPPPVSIFFLRADPNGGVTGGPTFGQTLFRFDPARNLLQNTPQVLDRGGEVYDGRWIGSKFYFVAYSGGDLGVWDPLQPWDQWNNRNPKLLLSYKRQEYGHLMRPIGGLVIGPKGRLYGGWSAEYGVAGGGLSEYDLLTGKGRAWTNDIVAKEMSIGMIAADDRYVYGVTNNQFSGIRRPPKPIVFFVFDPLSKKVVFQKILEGETGNVSVVRVPKTGRIWLARRKGLQMFDPEKLELVQMRAWPDGTSATASVLPADSQGRFAWFSLGKSIVCLEDGKEPTARAMFQADSEVGALAAGLDGKLYFTQGVDVWSTPLENVAGN